MVKTYPVPCSKEEMDKLLSASGEDDFCYMFFYVAKTTGRRLGEYYDVKFQDVDLEKGIMMTKVLKRRKRVEKEAILNDEAVRLIKQYSIRNKLNLNDYLFRKLGMRQIQNKVKVYSKKAGIIHNVSFHNFRHYFITELKRKGYSYDEIAKLTGHSSIETIACYDHVIASDLKEQVKGDINDL